MIFRNVVGNTGGLAGKHHGPTNRECCKKLRTPPKCRTRAHAIDRFQFGSTNKFDNPKRCPDALHRVAPESFLIAGRRMDPFDALESAAYGGQWVLKN